MTPRQLAARLIMLDWSQCSLQHQLAICAVLETLLVTDTETTMDTPSRPEAIELFCAPVSNVLPFPVSAARRPMHHRWVSLLHLDGREWCRAGFCGPEGAWGWIVEIVAAELECDPEAVHCAESEDGDVVTVDGLPVYLIRHNQI